MRDRIIRKPSDRRDVMIEKRALEHARHILISEERRRDDTLFAHRIAELDLQIRLLQEEISRYDAVRSAGLPYALIAIQSTIENLAHAPRTIIETRKTFDVTLAALGKKMGTTESAMSRLESDHYRTANLQKVIRIATAIASFRS